MKLSQLAILTKVAFKFSYKISTNLSPQELLKVTQKVENDLGRKRKLGGAEDYRP